MTSTLLEKPRQVSQPFMWWAGAVALGLMIFFRGYSYAFYALTAWSLYVIYQGYRIEKARIMAPALEHQRKYRKWYEEQAASKARHRKRWR